MALPTTKLKDNSNVHFVSTSVDDDLIKQAADIDMLQTRLVTLEGSIMKAEALKQEFEKCKRLKAKLRSKLRNLDRTVMASVKKVFDKLDEEGKVTSKHKGGSFKPPHHALR